MWLISLLLLVNASLAHSQSKGRSSAAGRLVIPIKTEWRFHEVGKDQWYPATVPGCVHTDLLANKLIDDPFYRDNEKKQQWIGKTDWEYQTTLVISPEILKRERVELVFEGLDTYADVFLNGKQVLNADNMFRTWRVDGKSALQIGENNLLVRFRSPINEVLPIMAKLNYQLPAPNDQGEKTSPFTRKAPYQYGWDWGPRFVTSGIWRPLRLEAWDRARITDLQIATNSIADDAAQLTTNIGTEANDTVNATVVLTNLNSGMIVGRKEVILSKGTNKTTLNFTIRHPALWWPNGLGAHPLYSFKAELFINRRPIDQATTRIGVRSLELRQQIDVAGKSFMFVINGIPVFAKGANWIPADSFPTRISKARYRQLVGSARDTNMNMLRVWGGGIYESNDFYDFCDEMGILIWQDFMFAGSMYPANPEFLDNVRHEAIDQVTRLRNHPSIVIWCGNNEIETGWLHWGWRKNLPASLWDDYRKIFEGVLAEVASTFDASRVYWPSSPHGGLADDADSIRSGDNHFWRVWHFAEPFANYEKQFPRFMSEFGFQSFPQIETVNSFTVPADRDIESPIMLVHQRHPRGNQLVREYMLREYPPPKDFESFLYVSQVLQAEGIRVGAEHLRRIRPRNMGSLYWQIDDCWPVASWSSIDYYGRWKALQYYARRFYSSLLVTPRIDNDNLNFWVSSDRPRTTAAKLHIELRDFVGHVLKSFDRNVSIAPLAGRIYFGVPVKDLLQGQDPQSSFVNCELSVNGKVASDHNYFFAPFKDLRLPKPAINFAVAATPRGFRVTLASDTFAKAAYLTVGDLEGSFSDNYVDLIPGKPVTVRYRTPKRVSVAQFRERLKIRSMVDAF